MSLAIPQDSPRASSSSVVPSPRGVVIQAPVPLSSIEVVLCSDDGEKVSFTSIWARHTTIVIFLRHFLCEACQEYMLSVSQEFKRLKPKADESEGTVQLAFVGCGKPKLGERLYDRIVGEGRPDIKMYVDESLNAYKAVGTIHALDFSCRRCCTGSALACWQGLTRCWCMWDSGDVKQQGGSFVFKPDGSQEGKCVYSHRESNPGAHAPLTALFQTAGLEGKPQEQQMK